MKKRINLEDVINNAEVWESPPCSNDSNKDIVVANPKCAYSQRPERKYKLADFACVHPLLPVLLKHEFAKHSSVQHANLIDGDLLRANVKILRNQYVSLTNTSGRNVVMTEIRSLDDDPSADFVQIIGDGLRTDTVLINGTPLEYAVDGFSEGRYQVHRSELDARYPGWKEREHAGYALGLNASELFTFILSNSQSRKPALPIDGVGFD